MYCLCCIHAVIISSAILGIDNHKNMIIVAYFFPKMQIHFIMQVNNIDLQLNYVDIQHVLC